MPSCQQSGRHENRQTCFHVGLRLSRCTAAGQDALPDPHRTLDHLCQRMDPNGPAGPLPVPNDQDGARLGGGDFYRRIGRVEDIHKRRCYPTDSADGIRGLC